MPRTIQVLIVEDHPLYRQALATVCKECTFIHRTFESADHATCLHIIRNHRIDLILMDYQLPGSTGLDCLKDIRKFNGKTKVVFVSQFSEPTLLKVIAAHGANGFMHKSSTSDQFQLMLKKVLLQNEAYWPRATYPNDQEISASQKLGKRELEVLSLVAEEYKSEEIAGLLSVSPKTVENHRRSILNKLGVKSMIGAVTWFNNLFSYRKNDTTGKFR